MFDDSMVMLLLKWSGWSGRLCEIYLEVNTQVEPSSLGSLKQEFR